MFAFNVYDLNNSSQYHPIQLASRGSHDLMELLLSYETFADMCCNGKWMKFLPDVITGDLKPLVVLLKTKFTHMEANSLMNELCYHQQGYCILLDNSLENALLLLRIGCIVHPHRMHEFSQPLQCAIIKSHIANKKKEKLDEGLDGQLFYLADR